VLLAAITMLAALLRLYHLGFKSIWLDEALVYWASSVDLSEVAHLNLQVRATPPLFTWITNTVLHLGDSEVALRALPLVFGVASVPAMYLLARHFLTERASMVCALLVALSTTQVTFSQQAREYTLLFLTATLSCWSCVRCMRQPKWSNWALLTFIWLVGLANHYGLGLLVAALNLLFLYEMRRAEGRRLLPGWVASQIPIALAVWLAFEELEIASYFETGAPGSTGYMGDAFWQGSLMSLARLAGTNTVWIFEYTYPAGGLLILLVAVGCIRSRSDASGRMAILMLVLPLVLTFLAACLGLYPYTGSRHVMMLMPMIFVLTGAGWSVLSSLPEARWLPKALVVILFALGAKSTWGYLRRPGPENVRAIVAELTSRIQEGDRVFVDYRATAAFRYYHRTDALWDEHRESVKEWLPSVHSSDPHALERRSVDADLAGQTRVWLVLSDSLPELSESLLLHAAQERLVTRESTQSGMRLYLAAR